MKSDIELEFGEEELKKIILKWYFKEAIIPYDTFEGYWYINDAGQNSFKIIGKF